MAKEFYDGTKLLSMKDINGNTPEIYMCTSNRSAGKTTYFSRYCVKKFLEGKGKFGLIYRFNYELDDCADKFFKDIGSLFFKGMVMESKRRASGIFHELFLDGKSCGYAVSLNSCDQLKKYSHLFSDIERIIFDEFQSENNHYCSEEVRKFISLHTTIARGQGQHVRYVPVFMLSNPVSIINPYYVEMHISERLRDDTKFLRGNGFVLEQGFVKSASDSILSSGFNSAFGDNKYVSYSAECIYLNDSQAFIDNPSGYSRYIGTLKYGGKDYGIREYPELGIIYCDDRADSTFKFKITVTTDDHSVNYVMLKNNDLFLSNLRYFFEKGCFRFKDLKCKEVLLKALSY
ncbi:MAG: phage DNA encapsidation protein [Clostridia bacterium]|nr:phage DNA encapsidation protein [Clostridia bacterium]